ncbi:hypothetical protein ACHAO8_004309 [Botrytis cinerea]
MPRRPYLEQDRSAPKRRRLPPRASQACHACASSKTRCDNYLTCARCRRRSIPCLRDAHLPDEEDETRDPATGQRAAVSDEIDASLPGTFQGSFDGVFSNQNSTAASNRALDFHAPQSPTQNTTDGLPGPPLVPATWGLDASFDLLNQNGPDGRLEWGDWGLNDHEIDFFTPMELPLLTGAAQAPRYIPTALASSEPSVDGDERTYSLQQAISQSIGQWTPKSGHYRAHAEKDMVSKDLLSLKIDFSGPWDPSISGEPLVPRTRDKLIALVVGSCERSNIGAVVSAFPTVDALECLINIALTQQKGDLDGYIHVPTFSKSESRVETIAAMVITGTSRSSYKAVQKFGYGLGEILSYYLYSRAEREYSLTRDLQYLQAFCLSLSDGLWSGFNNKMELAKSVSGVLINMLRVGGRFRRNAYSSIAPKPTDVGDILDKKWRAWVEQESFKRLVYHMHIHCVQESFMASTAGSQLSPSELTLPLPESRELWLAPSAIHWKQAFVQLQVSAQGKVPSIIECIANPSTTRLFPQTCDRGFASQVQVYAIASLVRAFKHTQALFATNDPDLNRSALIADESQERRLEQVIQALGVGYNTGGSEEIAAWNLLRELTSMHLYISFNQLELFAGQEGPDEAQAVYPTLHTWFQSESSRHAVWHAGQVLRHMRAIPVGALRIFHALACYHASLCLCIYGIISKRSTSQAKSSAPTSTETSVLLVDGEETLSTRRWIQLGSGTPVISTSPTSSDMSAQSEETTALSSATITMNVAIEVIRKKFRELLDIEPRLVGNICRLMQSIGNMDQTGSFGSRDASQ